MNNFRHHVSGFFSNRDDAEAARAVLIARGLPRERLHLFERNGAPSDLAPRAGSNTVLKNIIIDGAVGTAIGTGLGAIAELALVAANVSLFVASPLIAPLAMLGWGASLGGFIGAAVGAGNKEGGFPELIRDAIANGQVVLLAETCTEKETAIAQEVIKAAVGEYEDISTA